MTPPARACTMSRLPAAWGPSLQTGTDTAAVSLRTAYRGAHQATQQRDELVAEFYQAVLARQSDAAVVALREVHALDQKLNHAAVRYQGTQLAEQQTLEASCAEARQLIGGRLALSRVGRLPSEDPAAALATIAALREQAARAQTELRKAVEEVRRLRSELDELKAKREFVFTDLVGAVNEIRVPDALIDAETPERARDLTLEYTKGAVVDLILDREGVIATREVEPGGGYATYDVAVAQLAGSAQRSRIDLRNLVEILTVQLNELANIATIGAVGIPQNIPPAAGIQRGRRIEFTLESLTAVVYYNNADLTFGEGIGLSEDDGDRIIASEGWGTPNWVNADYAPGAARECPLLLVPAEEAADRIDTVDAGITLPVEALVQRLISGLTIVLMYVVRGPPVLAPGYVNSAVLAHVYDKLQAVTASVVTRILTQLPELADTVAPNAAPPTRLVAVDLLEYVTDELYAVLGPYTVGGEDIQLALRNLCMETLLRSIVQRLGPAFNYRNDTFGRFQPQTAFGMVINTPTGRELVTVFDMFNLGVQESTRERVSFFIQLFRTSPAVSSMEQLRAYLWQMVSFGGKPEIERVSDRTRIERYAYDCIRLLAGYIQTLPSAGLQYLLRDALTVVTNKSGGLISTGPVTRIAPYQPPPADMPPNAIWGYSTAGAGGPDLIRREVRIRLFGYQKAGEEPLDGAPAGDDTLGRLVAPAENVVRYRTTESGQLRDISSAIPQ